MEQIAPVLNALANLSVSVVAIVVLGLIAVALVKLLLTMDKSLVRIAESTETTHKLVAGFMEAGYRCNAREIYEECKRNKQ